ncbi:caldesmon [Neolamprologus brichardi]|uniref:caldesmon n=1 Tax=Neolamprologus brichardi TaxID=32507 RepID=UPI001643F673|nr:caldesmon [Neolamprologus brichardi]
MSNALVRRNSSKQGLQNLMRLTAQRSIEDAEEVERERRRRARESLRRRSSGSAPGESSLDGEMPPEENTYGSSLKPNGSQSLEEDEGFSDWTQRRERRRQQRLQELSQGGYEDEYEEEDRIKKAAPIKSTKASITSLQLQRQEQEDRDRVEMERRKEREEEMIRAERARREKEREEELRKKDELISRRSEESRRPHPEVEKRKEVKISYTSKVFLHQEPKHSNSNGNAANEEVTSFITKTKRSTMCVTSFVCYLIMCLSTHLIISDSQEERRRMKEEIERRRMEAAERMKNLSTSSVDEDEMFSPFSPKVSTQKITERTESLNRSLKKSNSFKKTQPLLLTSKIDDKLEQYAHAVENSQEARAVKASLNDLPQSPEVVASKKNLFEAGEAWSQSPSKGATCKDTEGLKVGVANLINQWVKGPSDGSRQLSSRPADLRPGDVMQKKNMWEVIGDSSGRPGQNMKSSAANKKYKFVVTGHGKYEKIPVDDEDEGKFTNGESDLCHSDY